VIHVLLPVHNRAAVTVSFARALAGQTRTDYRLVLIDDGSTDDTVERVRAVLPPERLVVVHGDGHLWWAGALQRGYLLLAADQGVAEGDAVLIANDDMTFGPGFLAAGMLLLDAHPDAAIQAVGHDLLSGVVDRGVIASLSVLRFRAAGPGERANCLSTRGLLMRVGVLLASGGFRPRWLPHYLSDYEFTLRLRRRGVKLICDERFNAVVRLEMTGREQYRRDGLRSFWNEAFSNRAKYNPKHMSAFILMTCSWWAVPFQLTRVWLRFAWAAMQAAFGRAAA
jgi:GT2 family glycosyltransferase